MKQVSEKPSISLQEAEEHYRVSSENYDVDSGESHLAYSEISILKITKYC